MEIGFDGISDDDAGHAMALIGKFIVTMSALDAELSQLVAALFGAGRSAISSSLIHAIDTERKREVLRAFIQLGPPETPEIIRLKSLLSGVGEVVRDRNTAAHGLLEMHGDEVCVASHNAARKFRHAAAVLRGDGPALLRVRDIPAKTEKAARLALEAQSLAASLKHIGEIWADAGDSSKVTSRHDG